MTRTPPRPELHENPEDQLAWRVRTVAMWFAAIILVLVVASWFLLPANRGRWLLIGVASVISSGLALEVTRRRRACVGGLILIGGTLAAIAVAGWTAGGLRAPAMSFLVPIIFMSGVMLGLRVAIGATVATVVLAGAMFVADRLAVLPASAVVHTDASLLLVLVLNLALMLVGVFVAARDVMRSRQREHASVEERRRSEAALHESERRIALALESVSDAVFDVDLLTGRAFCSPRYFTMLGFEPGEVVPSLDTWKSLLHPEDRDAALGVLAQYGDGKTEAHKMEVRLRTKDGSWRWVLSRGRITARQADGRPVRLTGTHVDITERREMQDALRLAEERLRMVVEHSTNLFFLHTPDHVLRYVSPQCRTLMDCEPEEAMIRWTEFVTEDPANAVVMESTQRALATGVRQPPYQCQLRTKHGRLLWVEINESPVVQDGKVVAIAGSITDITDRKRIESELASRELMLRTIAEHAPFGSHLYELQGDGRLALLGANRAADEILRTAHAALIGRDIDESFPAARGTDLAARLRRVARSGEPYHEPQARLTAGPVAGAFDLHAIPAGPNRLVLFFADVTERERAAEALRASEERFRILFNAGNDAVFVHGFSADGRPSPFRLVNDVAVALFGYERAELQTLSPIELNAPDALEHIPRVSEQLRREGRALFETVLLAKGGRRIPVEINSQCFAIAGEATVLSVVRDVTERKRLEDQLRQAQKMEVFGQLAGGVAHDFNNLLVAINGNAELLLAEGGQEPRAQEQLGQIREAGRRAAALTRQLLVFSRKQQPQPTHLDLGELVRNHVRMLRRIIGEDVQLEIETGAEPLPLHADANMLDQVLMNLGVNARDAMPEGGRLTLTTARRSVGGEEAAAAGCVPGDYAVLGVRDTGCGIAADVLPRIFEPFFTTKPAGRGTGLGLPTVLAIVQQHRGGIRVVSQPGRGTEVTVLLPLSSEEAPAKPEADGGRPEPRIAHARILVVEDDEAVRIVTARSLEKSGFRVATARDGVEGLARLEETGGAFDLVLSDVVMPGGVGGRELKAEVTRRWPRLPVILMSGYAKELETTGVRILRKPFSIPDLLAAVHEALAG